MCGCANVQMCEFFKAIYQTEFAHSHICTSAHYYLVFTNREIPIMPDLQGPYFFCPVY